MKAVLFVVMGLGLAVVGCGGNECEDAVDKMEECGFDLGDDKPSDDEVDECSEKNECSAKCINDASCDDIKTSSPSLVACAQACAK